MAKGTGHDQDIKDVRGHAQHVLTERKKDVIGYNAVVECNRFIFYGSERY
jgi:hypothetical protein